MARPGRSGRQQAGGGMNVSEGSDPEPPVYALFMEFMMAPTIAVSTPPPTTPPTASPSVPLIALAAAGLLSRLVRI